MMVWVVKVKQQQLQTAGRRRSVAIRSRKFGSPRFRRRRGSTVGRAAGHELVQDEAFTSLRLLLLQNRSIWRPVLNDAKSWRWPASDARGPPVDVVTQQHSNARTRRRKGLPNGTPLLGVRSRANAASWQTPPRR